AVEAVLERRRHLRRDAGERQETVAEVSGRDNAVFLAQGTRAPTVVGGRHNRRDAVARREVAPQRPEDDRQPGPAADGNNFHESSPLPRRARARPWPLPSSWWGGGVAAWALNT